MRSSRISSIVRSAKILQGQGRWATFKALDTFERRHIGPQKKDITEMLQVVGGATLDELTNEIVPKGIQYSGKLWEENAKSESEILDELKGLSKENTVLKSFLGLGFYGTKTPSVIIRNILESPGWYTPYTPYQAEIGQGRLESLMNFQTLVSDLTGLPVSNASLLDEATAVGEAVGLALGNSKHKKRKFFIDQRCHPQNIAVAETRASGLGVELVVGDFKTFNITADFCGVCVQYPDTNGNIDNYPEFFQKASKVKALSIVVTDLLACCLIKSPAEIGADVAVGSTQRFGVPMGFGGPHAAFLACQDSLRRIAPGRIIGLSKDVHGFPAYRMALQTREQHIRREKATSNICTAQALLANIAAMYAVYHGPEGLKEIAEDLHLKTKALALGLTERGHNVLNKLYFDTILVEVKGTADSYVSACLQRGYNIRKVSGNQVAIALDETTTEEDLVQLLEAAGKGTSTISELASKAAQHNALGDYLRTSKYLDHKVFNSYHNEMEMQRYIYRLEKKDLGLNTAMIPLGSCTLKLNAASEMLPITWPEFANLHPFIPSDQATGYHKLITKLQDRLCRITGFDACSLQPNAGSQGEYAGLRTIVSYLKSKGQGHRNVCLIPVSAHGTNPASAAMVGLQITSVNCDEHGNVDVQDLKLKAEQHANDLACLMITYPSTHGVFETEIKQICQTIHDNGGQVYLDGANMNAQSGLCRPGDFGADVCHLNLHKTFAIPHGGGGPGMGPICVKAHLAPHLPSHPLHSSPEKSFGAVSAANWGSAMILPISYAYIEMMGAEGVKRATQVAILAANYLKAKLQKEYNILFTSEKGHCAHEFILDLRPFKKSCNLEAEDVAKRLMDYGFHAPTLSFPVAGTLMIEPTESESKFELDRFVEAMLLIREEIREIELGKVDPFNNVLKNAPHPSRLLTGEWNYPYSREKAVFPTQFVKDNKYWPTISRIDNVYGDRNFVCCLPSWM